MIFWIFVILAVLSIAAIVSTKIISEKHSYEEEENTKFVNLVYHLYDIINFISGGIAIIGGVVVCCMLGEIIVKQAQADGFRAGSEQRYEALIYKAQTESIRDEFGIINKEYIDEVQSWNEDVAKYQANSNNFWIGIFYPSRAFDGFETINLEDIKMRE